jgi:alpha-D-ribose 1-methylphosphonate 5-triphosphate diphosphatase PhnM
MKTVALILGLLAVLNAVQTSLFAQPANRNNSPVALRKQTFAFTNVSVLPMDREIVLSNHTVIIKNGRIVAIGESEKTLIPEGAIRIDGRNKFLLPGLSDMHVHLPFNPDDINDTPALLTLFVANGVTTVLNLLGVPQHLAVRERIAKGQELAPVVHEWLLCERTFCTDA